MKVLKVFGLCLIDLCLIVLLCTVSLFPAKVIPLPDILNPDAIVVDKTQVYITAFPNVYIYALKDFKLIKKFGQQGEGPKEFNTFAVPSLQGNRIVFGDRGKVLYFDTNGDYIKEIKTKSIIHWGAFPVADGFVAKSRRDNDNIEYDSLNLYDGNLNKIKEIALYKLYIQENLKFDAVEVRGIQFQVYGDKIYFKRNKDFIIDVFDKTGQKIHTIEREYKKIAITEADQALYHDYFKTTRPWKRNYEGIIKNKLFFDDYFPAIQSFLIADDKIYVLTYEKKAGAAKFTILDLQGKLIKEPFLPLNTNDEWFHYSLFKIIKQSSPNPTFTIKNNTLYQLKENETTEIWELFCTPI